MKKTLIAMVLAVLTAGVNESPAQEQHPPVGVGLGLGVGAGVGLSGNIQVERIPGNVVQGRRLFVAKYLVGAVAGGGTTVTPPGPDADGDGTGGLTSACGSTRITSNEGYTTEISVYNPNTNAVTITVRALSALPTSTNAQTVTLQAGQAQDVSIASVLGNPPGFGTYFNRGLVVIESRPALEVIAFYEYKESSTHIQVSRELHEECGCNTKYHGCTFGP